MIAQKGVGMKFDEYKEIVLKTPFTIGLTFKQAIMWLNPSNLPIGVIGAPDDLSGVVRIPDRAENAYGKVVPVIAISKLAFSGNKSITDIVIPYTVDRLPAGCFKGCSGLERITIPKRVKTIKEGTFDGCENLKDVYYEGSLDEWKKINIVHERHEIEFGDLIPGTPVSRVESESIIHIQGNDALLSANIHFHCNLNALKDNNGTMSKYLTSVTAGGQDITDVFRVI